MNLESAHALLNKLLHLLNVLLIRNRESSETLRDYFWLELQVKLMYEMDPAIVKELE